MEIQDFSILVYRSLWRLCLQFPSNNFIALFFHFNLFKKRLKKLHKKSFFMSFYFIINIFSRQSGAIKPQNVGFHFWFNARNGNLQIWAPISYLYREFLTAHHLKSGNLGWCAQMVRFRWNLCILSGENLVGVWTLVRKFPTIRQNSERLGK